MRREKTCLRGFQQSEVQTSRKETSQKIEFLLVASLDMMLSN